MLSYLLTLSLYTTNVIAMEATHGWSIQTITHPDAIGVMFTRGTEVMTSEWADGLMPWSDYSHPSEPDGIYTENADITLELLSSVPTR